MRKIIIISSFLLLSVATFAQSDLNCELLNTFLHEDTLYQQRTLVLRNMNKVILIDTNCYFSANNCIPKKINGRRITIIHDNSKYRFKIGDHKFASFRTDIYDNYLLIIKITNLEDSYKIYYYRPNCNCMGYIEYVRRNGRFIRKYMELGQF